LPGIIRNQAIEAGLKCFELECISLDKVRLFASFCSAFIVAYPFYAKINNLFEFTFVD